MSLLRSISFALLTFLILCTSGKQTIFAKSVYSANQSQILFVENKNQWERFIHYEAEIKGGKLFLEKNRFTYVFFNQQDIERLHPEHENTPTEIRLHAMRVSLVNSNSKCLILPSEKEDYYRNYFIGSDPSKWASEVGLYKDVSYQNVYSKIDLRFYSQNSNLKYDFIVKPGGNVNSIALNYEGTDEMRIEDGSLIIKTSVGEIIEQKPYAFQLIGGVKKEVPCSFKLKENTIRFLFPEGYDHKFPLIIDPTLIFSSYSGSSADNWGFTATYDAAGNAYAGGNVNSIGYPVTTGAYKVSYNGGGSSGNGWSCDMAIAKFNPTGTAILYATYLGGSDNEQPQSLVVDKNNNLLIFGVSYSSNFPTTTGAYQTTKSGGGDIVVSKLNPSGSTLLASTFIGGSNDDGVNSTAIDNVYGPIKYNYGDDARGEIIADANNYYVSSCTQSSNFPTTTGAFQTGYGNGGQDGVVLKINSNLTNLIWSTYLGGNGMDAAYSCLLDAGGNLFVTGGTSSSNFPTTAGSIHSTYQGGAADGFITHLGSNGNSVLQSTYIGTNKYDQTFFVQQDVNGNIYTMGQTEGSYPVTAGVYSNAGSGQFIQKLNPTLSASVFSTVFGNGNSKPTISPTAFLVDTCENLYVSGWARCIHHQVFSNLMPLTTSAFQSTTDGCDFYFIVLSKDALAIQFGSYYGSPSSEDHVDGGTSRFDANGMIYQSVCAGCGGKDNFPTTPGVVSNTNNSINCNNAILKIHFDFSKTRAVVKADPDTGCVPHTVQFTNSSINGVTYTWDFGDGSPISNQFQPSHTYNTAGTYQVMLISRNNLSCNVADTTYIPITIFSPVPIIPSMSLVPASTCDSFFVQSTSVGTGGNLYTWRFGDGSTASGISAQHMYASSGTYSITLVVNDSVCNQIDSVTKPVRFKPNIDARISTDNVFQGCAPQLLTLKYDSILNSSGTVLWDFGDGITATGSPLKHTYISPGTYTIRMIVTDTSYCNIADTSFFTIDIYARPKAGFYDDAPLIILPNTKITFTDTSLNGINRVWDFGDKATSTDSISSHEYAYGGSFSVCLTASSAQGCIDSKCRTIEVIPLEEIYVPNSFSPNGDGKNEVFKPETIGIFDMEVRVLNRWGDVIKTWKGLDGSWDGKTNGKKAPEDVYIYYIDAKGSVTPVITKIGRVTLIY